MTEKLSIFTCYFNLKVLCRPARNGARTKSTPTTELPASQKLFIVVSYFKWKDAL